MRYFKLFTLLSVFLLSNKIIAQNVSWIKTGSGDGGEMGGATTSGYSIITDNENIYLSATANGSILRIDQGYYNMNSGSHLISYNKDGDYNWHKEITSYENGYLAISNKGEIYAGGGSYIKKFDTSGNLLHTKELFQNNLSPVCNITAINIDNEGAIIVSGTCNGIYEYIEVEDTSIYIESSSGFVMKYNEEFEFEWISLVNGQISFNDLETDIDNNIYLCGEFTGDSLLFGDEYISSLGNTHDDYVVHQQDIIIAKLDIEGKLNWVKAIGGYGDDYGNGIVLNNSNELILTGAVYKDLIIEEYQLTSNYKSMLIAKFSLNGDYILAKLLGENTTYWDTGRSVEVDDDDNIYVVGAIGGYGIFGEGSNIVVAENPDYYGFPMGFVAKFDTDINFKWLKHTKGYRSRFLDLCVDNSNDIYITGYTILRSDYTNTFDNIKIHPADKDCYNVIFSKITQTTTTNWNKLMNAKSIKIYPNPSTGIFSLSNFHWGEKTKYKIYNTSGQIVGSGNIRNNNGVIDGSKLNNGIYLVKITVGNSYYINKLIIEK